jgi:hypothetical protein
MEGRYHLKDPGICGRIIGQWILEKEGRKVRTGFIWLRIGGK